jgi:hypothetical protein
MRKPTAAFHKSPHEPVRDVFLIINGLGTRSPRSSESWVPRCSSAHRLLQRGHAGSDTAQAQMVGLLTEIVSD